MDLSPFLDGLRRDLAASVAAAGPETARAGELLAGAIEPAARLTLLEVLSEAAAEITAALDDVEVDVRMRGRDADLVVTEAAHPAPAAPPPAEAAAAPEPEGDTARITLRLPEQLKAQVERAAAAEGISVNSWLVRAAAAGLHAPPLPPVPPPPPFPGRRGRRITGFAQG